MISCNLCLNIVNTPIKLPCQHTYCFLCLKYNLIETEQITICPVCHDGFNDTNLNSLSNAYIYNESNVNYVWLYSSNYNNAWWTYNNESNNKIEKIYKDYLLRQEILNTPKDKDNLIKFNIVKTKKHQKQTNNNIEIEFDNITIDNDIDNCVDFSNIESTSNQFHNETLLQETPLSYIIKCGTFEYKIDFDLMKQINTIDTWKKRSIKRLAIPVSIAQSNMESITCYLDSQNVIGIAGKKF